MKRILEFLENKKYLFYGLLGALLLSMSFQTQTVILKYGDEYALKMEYTVYGYCVRASASLKATEPAVYNEMYFGNSYKVSVLKAVNQLEKLGGEGKTIELLATGFPRDNEKLQQSLKAYLEQSGKAVEIISTQK